MQPSEVVTANLIERMTMTTRITNWGDPRLPERFWSKTTPEPNSGCWLWLASTNGKGYGTFWFKGACHRVYKLAFVTLVGEVPAGLVIDHLCRNTLCCNPAHLESVPHAVNVQRGISGWNSREKTHCPRGHIYDAFNTRHYRGRRHCRACGYAAVAARDAKRRLLKVASSSE